jgi:hypothetical protein
MRSWKSGFIKIKRSSIKIPKRAKRDLQKLGVDIRLNTLVQSFNGKQVELSNGEFVESRSLVWALGVKGNIIQGLPEVSSIYGLRNKLVVFINWAYNYFTYDKGTRLIIRRFTPRFKKEKIKTEAKVSPFKQESQVSKKV